MTSSTPDMPQQPVKAKDQPPWALVIGIVALVIAFMGTATGGGIDGTALVWGFVGLLLTCTGLIQRTIQKSRR